ncbi:hypothetical protein L593_00360 [Salinarchaeum sp. Harcht-Bsk1]|uniref:pyridoxamine 5'-phosphate oxidase family protein n=1 Tax=Salinarchaeum sp. Harcht-Bsk1 TaxID=1333523 RepID=UPI0003423ED6|nr:pyridoxamine 5'-phosphate oxidase family protein [Salinarchaeum sp. Harcht-Bsk1]AGN00027.1 hypothetical protein L593_00360 [Salinarchaeum sp. Harcht-Bsk1]
MTQHEPVDLTAEERADRLGTGGVGVLSLDTGTHEPPHAVPVSYGFDPVEEVFYFRLAVGGGSTKGDVNHREAAFVVHEENGDDWWSVVAHGELVRTDEESVSTASLEGLDRVRIPFVDAFEAPPEEISFAFVRLEPHELTGRRSD